MIIRPIFWFLVLFLNKITYGVASNVMDTEQRLLDRNLKSLRNDFNKLIETIEDFAGDFLKQIHDAGRLMENTYITDNDYNWQDDNLNPIEKTTKNTNSFLPTITETTKAILGKTLTLPKLHFPKIPNLITKNIEQEEMSNDIEKREKRSTQTMPREFENIPPAPMMIQDGQHTPSFNMPKNVELRSSAPTTTISDFPPFTDKTSNVEGDKKDQDIFLGAKQSDQEQAQTSGSTTLVPNEKTKDPLICTAKSQKDMDLERQKMEELKEEVKKLNDLVALLRDQQRIMKVFNNLDKHLSNNEVNDEDGNIKNSYLYKTLKHLQNNKKDNDLNALQKSDKDASSNIQTKLIKSDKSDTHIQNAGPTFKDLEKLKLDLRDTAENLNKTKEELITEKQKEEELEQELKRQNSELKFLKVMTESLYDKMGYKKENGHKAHETNKLRNSDNEDVDVDSLLGSVHTPKTMPARRKYSGAGAFPESFANSMSNQNVKSRSLLDEDFPTDRPLTRDELLAKEHREKYQKLMDEWAKDPDISAFLKKDAMLDYASLTEDGLRQLAKEDKDRYKKFFPASNTRESNTENNRDSDIHKILAILSRKENENINNENDRHNGKERNPNEKRNIQNNLHNNLSNENNTYLSTNARASSGKTDDIALKLKLLEALTKEGKSDDTSSKEKELNEAMKKLLEPEKKSDDNQLDSLIALFKEKQEEPKPEKSISQENLKKLFKELNAKPQSKSDDVDIGSELKELQKAISSLKPKEGSLNLDFNGLGNTAKGKQDGDIQENLKKLFKELNAKPQSKSDDVDIGNELKQLQKAISSLRPKEDSLLDNLDLNGLGNTVKGKQDGDIQSMLSQLIAQSGEGAGHTGVDLGGAGSNLDLSNIINPHGGSSITSGSLDLSGGIDAKGDGKFTPQQLFEISKIMGANSFNGVPGSGSSHGGFGGNSNPAVQHLLNQYLAPSHLAPHKDPNGYSNQIGNLNELFTSYGSPQYPNPYSGGHTSNLYGPNSYQDGSGTKSYGTYNLNSYGSGTNSYTPDTTTYGANSNLYGAGLNSYNPNSYASSVHPYNSNSYNPGPNSKPYSGSGTYRPNSGSYGSSYGVNSLGYDSNTPYETENYGQEEYGARPNFLGPNLDGNYNSLHNSEPSSSYPEIPHFTIPALPTYDVSTAISNSNTAASKNGYQPASYKNMGSGGYQGATDYQNDLGYGKSGFRGPGGIGSRNYGSPNNYFGVTQGNKASYGSKAEQNEASGYQNYDKGFFPSARPSGNIGANYQGNNYFSKGYGRPGVDKSYGNGQTGDQYQNSLASDLAKQIENLESAITGLNTNDYTQTPADKATVGNLEQRIYELKDVISSLNKPAYGPQRSYQGKQLSYSPQPSYAQNQGSYKQPQQSYPGPASYGGGPQKGGPPGAYGSPSQTPSLNGQTETGHSPYNPYQASSTPSQPPYGTGPPAQTPYANSSPPQAPSPQPYQEPQPSYTPTQPSSPNYSPEQPNQHPNSPPAPYPPGPQVDTHSPVASQPAHPPDSPPYQPKTASGDDRVRGITHVMRKDLRTVRSTRVQKSRRKRQVNNTGPPEMPSQTSGADMTISMRQNYDGPVGRPAGYNIKDDAFTQIANTFKQYLEESLNEDEIENDQKRYQPANNQDNRNSAVEGLQEKLEFLKKQLESQQSSGRSLSNFFGLPGITNPIPPAPITYGSNHFLNNQYNSPGSLEKTGMTSSYATSPPITYGSNHFSNSQSNSPGITSLEKSFSDKKQDIFTQIVLKLLEKVLGTLPSVLHRLFGNLASSVGDSYGDNYSPLQSVFKNMGALGYMPLILIKLLDTTSVIMQHLGKNKLFKDFLIPAGAVAGAALVILFLIYFYQQDEPHGYIGYQGNNYNKYPQYDSSSYGHSNYGATGYGNNRNYKSDSYYNYYPNHRSNMEPLPNYNDELYGGKTRLYGNNLRTYNNPDFGGTNMANFKDGDVPLRYSRGYYDYFENRFRSNKNKNVYR